MKRAEAAITAAKADANRTAVDLKYTVLTAPISGRIDRALVTKGNLLTGGQGSGTLLTKIVNEQPMYVYFDVDERSLLRYMRQRAETRETAPGSLRDAGHRLLPATRGRDRISPTKGSSILRPAKSIQAQERPAFAACLPMRNANWPAACSCGSDSGERALPGAADSRAGIGHGPEHQVCVCRRRRRHGRAGARWSWARSAAKCASSRRPEGGRAGHRERAAARKARTKSGSRSGRSVVATSNNVPTSPSRKPRPLPQIDRPQPATAFRRAPAATHHAGALTAVAKFFIDRPIFAAVISVIITLAGGIAVGILPVAQYPEITPPTVQVTCTYPGASSKVVADTVAAPIEQQVIGVENMLYMSSQMHQRRRLQPDRDVRSRHESRHGPGARAEPRQPGAAHAAERGEADRRQRQEEVAQHPAGRQSHFAQGHATTSSISATTPRSRFATSWPRSKASAT